METIRWTTALLLALFVHIAGLLWIEPVQKSIAQPETLSESIVVILAQGTGEAAQTARLLNVPNQTPAIEPLDTSSDQTPARVHERLATDVETVVDEVAVPPAKRSTMDLEAIDTLDAKIVEKQAPKVETVSIQTPAVVESRIATEDGETDTTEIPIAVTLAAKDPVIHTPSPPTTRAESQSAEVAERVTAALLADGEVKVMVSTPIASQTEGSEVEVVEITTTTDVIEKGGDIAVSSSMPEPPANPSDEAVEVMAITPTTDVIEKGDDLEVSSPMSEPPAKPGDEAVEVVTTGPLVVAAREVQESQPVSTENRGSDVGAFEISVPAAVEESPGVDVSTPVAEPVGGPETSSTVMPEASPKSSIAAETEAAIKTTSHAVAVLSLDTVVAVDDRGAITAPPRPDEVLAVDTPQGVQVARAVTLEELMGRSPGGKGVVARYAGLLKGWLQENMHYPRSARLAGQEGVAIVRFVIDRNGMVRSIQLEQQSGHRILDREAVEMIERAEPFPVMPADMAGGELELRVPVSFHINDESLNKNIPPIYLE